MDNKPLEKQAESYIKSQLLRFGFKVHDLSFDEKGSDLMISQKSTKQTYKYITVQCKGRRLNNTTSSIKIPISYVEDNFIIFLYTLNEEDHECLFVFLSTDIKAWKINKKEEYVLSLTTKKLQSEIFTTKLFNKDYANKIQALLDKSEPKEYTSIFIDGIFLEKAIYKTIQIYSSIWPKKKYTKPDLNSIINYILEAYNKFKTEKEIVNCFLFMSKSFSLENIIHIDYENQKFVSINGNKVRVFINKTDEMISFEILEDIDRLIGNDNIILVANDRAYEYDLGKFKKKNFDMIVVRFNMKDGNDMQSEFRWADVTWPLGRSLGLKIHEL